MFLTVHPALVENTEPQVYQDAQHTGTGTINLF